MWSNQTANNKIQFFLRVLFMIAYRGEKKTFIFNLNNSTLTYELRVCERELQSKGTSRHICFL